MSSHTCTLMVLNHNGSDLLARFLPSVLRAAAAGGHRVLVVDNQSSDDSREVAASLGCEVYAHPRNDFLMSLNVAAQNSSSDVLIMLNNDLEVRDDFVAPLLRHFRDPKVFSVGCRLLDPDGVTTQIARTSGHFVHGVLEPVHHVEQLLDPADSGPMDTLYTPGGACAVHRQRFLELGGFHPLLAPIYWEDVDLGYSAWRRGWRCVYEPESVAVHYHSVTTTRLYSPEWIKAAKLKNQLLITAKNVTDRGILLQWLRTVAFLLRKSWRGPERWQLSALARLLRQVPAVLAYRASLPADLVPDREICPVFRDPKASAGVVGWLPSMANRAQSAD